VPVIEAYGMTEAAHQMASNPLPPRARKPRSVGQAAGPQVAIMSEGTAALLPSGGRGEIVIRGPNVTAGYSNNPEANARAFTDGWFRTGDQGYLDDDHYLFITGRLKELINRGGEKIAPGEVEEALLDHPGVAQAVAFAVPDTRLGEDVAAAVVARPGAAPTATELRRFVSLRLADYKVPRQVLILDEIPKGPTGKMQRIGLADKLGLSAEPDRVLAEYAPPANDIEELLAELWQAVLLRDRVGRHDRFLDLGGDSLLATELVARVEGAFQMELSILEFFDAPTVAEQAALVEAWLDPGAGSHAEASDAG
jgi:acyl carrier protein